MKWVKTTLTGNTFSKVQPHNISAVVFSEKEFDYTIEALKKAYNLTDEHIRSAEKGLANTGEIIVGINFNKSKKSPEQLFAKISIKPTNGETA